jgi:hypothetical protein
LAPEKADGVFQAFQNRSGPFFKKISLFFPPLKFNFYYLEPKPRQGIAFLFLFLCDFLPDLGLFINTFIFIFSFDLYLFIIF